MNESKIASTDTGFMRASLELGDFFRDHQVSLFTGAGISVPSGIPNSKTLVKSITSSMVRALHQLNLGTIGDRELVDNTISGLRLEPILDSIVQFHEKSPLDSLLDFRFAKPNYNHKSAAKLASHGYLSNIITLNFDVLFETSLREVQVPFVWSLPLAGIFESPTNAESYVNVIKPHGTLPLKSKPYEDYYLVTTLQYVGDHPQVENIKAIDFVAKKSPVLIVCGYADYDWDIFPILTSSRWERVYWIQHLHDTPLSVISWLKSLGDNSSWLLYGDVRLLFKQVLEQLDISNNNSITPDLPTITPDVSHLNAKPAETAFAAVSLLNGKENKLYRSLLDQLGHSDQVLEETRLLEAWERAKSWVHHSHEGKPHKAIQRYRKIIPLSSQLPNNHMGRLNDCRSMHYEHISTLKRPYFNPLLFRDIFHTLGWRRELLRRVAGIESSQEVNPFIKRESSQLKAFPKYDVVDLYHNWGYHLLPFVHKFSRNRIANIFGVIARKYDQLANEYPDMDWEYRLVRRVEAHLLADNDLAPLIWKKLLMVREMFEQTGQSGHLANVEAMIAIAKSNIDAFLKAEERMINLQSASTPSGRLRIILLKRYFWPEELSFYNALKSLITKSRG